MEIEELVDDEYVDDNGDPIIQELCDEEETYEELHSDVKIENEEFLEEVLEDVEDNIIEEELNEDGVEDDDDEDEQVFFCNSCGTTFADFDAHVKQYHPTQSIVVEEGEAEDFIKKETEDQDEYILSDAVTKDIVITKKCSVCELVLGNASDFREHMRTEHENLIRAEYTCQTCGLTFGFRKEITQHQKDTGHTNKMTMEEQCINRTFLCALCDIYFNSYKEYTSHRKEYHSLDVDKWDDHDKDPAFCTVCNTLFPSARNLT